MFPIFNSYKLNICIFQIQKYIDHKPVDNYYQLNLFNNKNKTYKIKEPNFVIIFSSKNELELVSILCKIFDSHIFRLEMISEPINFREIDYYINGVEAMTIVKHHLEPMLIEKKYHFDVHKKCLNS